MLSRASDPHLRQPQAAGLPIGRLVAAGRALCDVTLTDFAAASGLSPSSLSRLENGLRGTSEAELTQLPGLLEARLLEAAAAEAGK